MAQDMINGVTDLQPIARGGTSVVYRGTQQAFGRTVAVKVLNANVVDANQRARFERECRSVGALSGHPNVVTVHDAGLTADGHPYLVMEYLPRSLADVLAERGPLPWTEAVAVGTAMASALSAAHTQGVLHRDVKPQNVLLAGDVPKLTDFGLARFAGTAESQTASITASFTHASPELVQGQAVDERSDVYSLASTLHELLSGAPPFVRPGDESLVPVISRIVTEPPPSLGRHGVPLEVEAVLVAAMAKDPARRPRDVATFARELAAAARAAGDATVPADLAETITFRRSQPAPTPTRDPRRPHDNTPTRPPTAPARRRRSLFVAVGLVAVLGIAAIAWAASRSGDDGAAGDERSSTTAGPTSVTSGDAEPTTAATTATTVAPTTAGPTTGGPTTAASVAVVPPSPFTVSFDSGDSSATIEGSLTDDDLDALRSGLLLAEITTDGVERVDGDSPDAGATAGAAQTLLVAMQSNLTEGTLTFDGTSFTIAGKYPSQANQQALRDAVDQLVEETEIVVEPLELTPAPTTTTSTTVKPTTSGGVRITSFTTETGSRTFTIPADDAWHYFGYNIVATGGSIGFYCPVRNNVATGGHASLELGVCFPPPGGQSGRFEFKADTPGTWSFTLWVCDGEAVTPSTCTQGERSSNSYKITLIAE